MGKLTDKEKKQTTPKAAANNTDSTDGVSMQPPIQKFSLSDVYDTVSDKVSDAASGVSDWMSETFNSLSDDSGGSKSEEKGEKTPVKKEDDPAGGGTVGDTLDISSSVGFSESFSNKKKDVLKVQNALIKLGYNIKASGKLQVYKKEGSKKLRAKLKDKGKQTVTAIHSFQYISGLKPNGKIKKNGDTHKKINEALKSGMKINHNYEENSKLADFPTISNANIQESHLLTKDKKGEGLPSQLFGNMKLLMKELEVIGSEYGKVKVISGYRSPKANSTTGGKAEGSNHMFGMAVDLVPKEKGGVEVLRTKIIKLIKDGKITKGGVGRYSSFVHYDVRGKNSRWDG
jgi:uncharacterized protein YcbK (DUF882 family)